MINLVRIALLLLVTAVAPHQKETTTREVKILPIDNDKGQILIGLYDSVDAWLKKPYKGIFGKIEDGKCMATFTDIPAGAYVISVFHNKDNEEELDPFLDIPTEDGGSVEQLIHL